MAGIRAARSRGGTPNRPPPPPPLWVSALRLPGPAWGWGGCPHSAYPARHGGWGGVSAQRLPGPAWGLGGGVRTALTRPGMGVGGVSAHRLPGPARGGGWGGGGGVCPHTAYPAPLRAG